jgi:hypothetical protein
MHDPFTRSVVALVAVLAFSSVAAAQGVPQHPPSVGQRLSAEKTPVGPAPKRDLTGTWAGAGGSRIDPPDWNALMTPLAKKLSSANKPEGTTSAFSVAESNDPLKTCDPLGFPQNIIFETRAIAFAQMADRVVQLFQYQRVYREIWTDGRALPKDVGGKDGPDARWYAYSVGHWEDDYTFVVNSVGSDARSWLDHSGHVHSVDLRVEERYKRVDHDNLALTVTIDDPKMYTKPFVIAKPNFKWIPKQEYEEQLCVPSEGLEYLKVIGNPAGTSDGKAVQ